MIPVAARVAAETQRMRDGLEARSLARELGCEVTAHPELAGRVEAWDPLPGLTLLIGTPDEVRAEVVACRAEDRARLLRLWLSVLGSRGQP